MLVVIFFVGLTVYKLTRNQDGVLLLDKGSEWVVVGFYIMIMGRSWSEWFGVGFYKMIKSRSWSEWVFIT